MATPPNDGHDRRPGQAPRLFAVPAPIALDEDDINDAELAELVVNVDEEAKQTGAGGELAIPDEQLPALFEDEDIVDAELVPLWRQDLPDRRVLPVWLAEAEERRLAARWAASYGRHVAAYHTVRVPLYGLRIVIWAPRGGYRLVRRWADWAFDAEGRPLRQGAVQRGDDQAYLPLTYVRNDRVRLRLQISGGVAAAAVTVVGLWALWPEDTRADPHHPGHRIADSDSVFVALVPYVLLLAVLIVLGYLGRPRDRAIIERAIITAPEAQRLDPSQIVRALGALGIAEINKALSDKGEGITFVGDPVRDGPGWRADVDLPYGVTPQDIIAKSKRLASGLRRNAGCVWPEGDPDEHEGRLILWVGDRPLRRLTMPPWPLLREGRADIFRALPFAVDVRGRPVDLTLIYSNLLVGAQPRMGKTFSIRVLLLGCALDPIVQLRVFELKGTGDLAPLRKVSHHYASGITDPAIRACLASLENLDRELEVRGELIAQIAEKYPDLCPENKVTRQICEDPRWRETLRPIVIVVDEAQNLFGHPEMGDRAADLAEKIVKVGPALGIIAILATQKPNAKSLPTGVRSIIMMRLALRVADQDTNDMILGTGHYKRGNNAMRFSRKDMGCGLLLGEEDEPQILRTFYIDTPTADRITERALELRREAGTVTGVAAGELEAIAPATGLPEHLAAAWTPGEAAMWLEVLLPRIADAHPELYADWSTVDLGNACRAAGIARKDIGRGSGANKRTRRGIDRQALE